MLYAALLLVSPESATSVEKLGSALSAALGDQAPAWRTSTAHNGDSLAQHLAQSPRAHLTFIDGPRAEHLKFLEQIKAADDTACVFVLTDKLLPAAETMRWIDAGATGFLRRDFRGADLTEPLREALTKRLRAAL